MQRAHRRAHRWIWPVLLGLALAILLVSTRVRPEYPTAPGSAASTSTHADEDH